MKEVQSSAREAKDGFIDFFIALLLHVIVEQMLDAQIDIWAIKHDLSHRTWDSLRY
jgi:hypothetical protein